MTVTDAARRRVLQAITAGAIAVAGCADSSDRTPEREPTEPTQNADSDDGAGDFLIETVVKDLTRPWGMAFLPDGDVLITERTGGLHRVGTDSGRSESIENTPSVHTAGQGGLLDVAVHPRYSEEPWVYLTYAASNEAGDSTTHLGRGQLQPSKTRLDGFEKLHAADPFVDSTQHYGSRAVFGPDDMVYMTVGDRGAKDFGPDHVAQDTTNELGTTLRLAPDGSIPDDNPFVDDPDVVDSIYSYGHRNAQGMTLHPDTGEVWQGEHGEQDGDEINVIEAGGNYGWPIASYACNYGTDDPVGDLPHERDDTVAPVYHWPCGSGGYPPAGMAFYDGDAFPGWQGDLFVGNLAGKYLGRFTVEDGVKEADPLLADRGWRIRDVAVAPGSGYLYVVVDAESAPLLRFVPA